MAADPGVKRQQFRQSYHNSPVNLGTNPYRGRVQQLKKQNPVFVEWCTERNINCNIAHVHSVLQSPPQPDPRAFG